jgi:hypothetical protein
MSLIQECPFTQERAVGMIATNCAASSTTPKLNPARSQIRPRAGIIVNEVTKYDRSVHGAA